MFGIVVVGLLALKSLAGRVVKSLFLTPFKMKGKVLREATIEIHDVTPTEPPFAQDDEEEFVDDEKTFCEDEQCKHFGPQRLQRGR